MDHKFPKFVKYLKFVVLTFVACTAVWLLVGKPDRDRTLETLKYRLIAEADLRAQAMSAAMFRHQQAAVLLARTKIVKDIVVDASFDESSLQSLSYLRGLSGVTALHILSKDRVSSFPAINDPATLRSMESSRRMIDRAFNGGLGRGFHRDSASRPIYSFATPIYLDELTPYAVLLVRIDLSVTAENWQTSEHYVSMFDENGSKWVDNDVATPDNAVSISRSFESMGTTLVISSKPPSWLEPWIFRSVFLCLVFLLTSLAVSSLIERRKMLAALSSQKECESKRLEYQANYDELTGLPNRRYILNHLKTLLSSSEVNAHILLLDLDHFKSVNDTLGHAAGDELLQQAATRLQQDADSETVVARLGGDEFLLVSNSGHRQHRKDDIDALVKRIIRRFEEPFVIGGKTCKLPVSPSIGITKAPEDGTEIEQILRNADTAMYMAKELGRNTACRFTPEMDLQNQLRLSQESKLRYAISSGDEFKLYYQPQIDMQTNRMVGVEAFIQWFHPDEGLIPPDRFIPLAEQTGLILPIGQWVLYEAARHMKQWYDDHGMTITVSINVAGRQLQQPDFYDEVAKLLVVQGLYPDQFGFEITETSLVGDDKTTQSNIAALSDVGINFSLDDFGTGYSALSYLKKYPFDNFKIDRSFIQTITEDDNDAALVQGMVTMSKNIGLRVLSEGVETIEQHNLLKKFGCDIAQGFYYSKPLPADELITYLKSTKADMTTKAA